MGEGGCWAWDSQNGGGEGEKITIKQIKRNDEGGEKRHRRNDQEKKGADEALFGSRVGVRDLRYLLGVGVRVRSSVHVHCSAVDAGSALRPAWRVCDRDRRS